MKIVIAGGTGFIGAKLVLNEQIPSGNNTSSLGLTTNAIDLTFVNVVVAGLGTLNGQVIVAQSQVFVTTAPVPEPSSFCLFGIAAAGLGLGWRRHQRRA